MYLKIGKKKIKIEIRTSFWKRLKGYMFVFDPIQVGLCYPKCKSIHTYLMCQRIDVVMTDKNFQILYLYPNLKSEKVIFPKKNVYYTFELPPEFGSWCKLKYETSPFTIRVFICQIFAILLLYIFVYRGIIV